jgi:predicted ATP-binding protein involved in virulence
VKFFIKKVFLKNRSPFENLEINFSENEIAVLTAVNGKGKTTIISHIVDALHEISKKTYRGTYAGKESKFYRVSRGLDQLDNKNPSIFYLRMQLDNQEIDYVNILGATTEKQYNEIPIENKIPYKEIEEELITNQLVKHSPITKEQTENIFNRNIATYFPSYRYEQPNYINSPYEVRLNFKKDPRYTGSMINPIEVISGLDAFANWVMDIVLDMQYQDENIMRLKGNADRIVTLALGGKIKSPLRFGVGQRNQYQTRVQIVDENTDITVYPSIFTLSAGEAATVSMFGEILRQADNVQNNVSMDKATGVVLIDEIDKHLHIKIQKEVLPLLLEIFPNIQFILSSHSPFLSLGLAHTQKARSKIIDLDNFGITQDPTSNDLYTEVYEMMVSENERFRDHFINLKETIAKGKKPLIITEGKTDVLHLQKAQECLGIEIDIEYFDAPGDWGDSKLKALIEQLAKIPQERLIIGIFDRDVKAIVDQIEENGADFKNYGNNVFGICLPIPEGREQFTNISIEFYYSDDEIKKIKDGKRLHFDNEVCLVMAGDKTGGQKPILLNAPDPLKENSKKIFDKDIELLPGAHSKSRFARLIKDDIEFSNGLKFDKFKSIFERLEKIIKIQK